MAAGCRGRSSPSRRSRRFARRRPTQQQSRVLDRFDDLAAWKASASDGVNASIGPADGISAAAALRLDFDLGGTAGYALAAARCRSICRRTTRSRSGSAPTRRSTISRSSSSMRAATTSGGSVRRNFEFPREWRQVRIRKRQIEFAWGPTQDRELRHAATARARRRGRARRWRGSVYFSDLVLRALAAAEPASWPIPMARALRRICRGAGPQLSLDGDAATAWQSDPAAGPAQTLTIDFGVRANSVAWSSAGASARMRRATTCSSPTRASAGERCAPSSRVAAAPTRCCSPKRKRDSSGLRSTTDRHRRTRIAEIEVKDLAFGASPNAFFEALARDAPRG